MTEILAATPVSQVASGLSLHLRTLALADRKRINNDTDLSALLGMPYPRLRHWLNNPGVVPNEMDLAALLKHYMPEYAIVPAMVVPVAVG